MGPLAQPIFISFCQRLEGGTSNTNDGSTDSSRAIVQEYLDAGSRFHVTDKANSGYGASMNQGLDAATG